ncbi:hypothetical protein GDO81_008455 [Engystomops pustulosus]|uniref:A kinase-anchoring proteins AKAP-5 and AKAP-12 calmodulin (CaM)-binding domain-containing protein n=1 Tax=Engystomops pustulosus TaxID=76066 RepID=A0AAV7CFS4_ENGPU|nr:hypothetical protein GDO81_008455 [Engystomops pustulosus]
MGAGTSTEQAADKPTEEQVEQCVDLGQSEQDGEEVEVNTAGDAKLLQTNGKVAIINGATEEGEGVEGGLQASDVNGHGTEEEILAVVKEVEQQEPASIALHEEPAENMGVVNNDTTTKETPKEDGQIETPEVTDTDTTPETEEKAESPDQANENQSNEVGFKKVFKFVGFKFTVKKDKTEKSEPVKLLNVKKEEVEVNGTDNHEEHIDTATDEKTEVQQDSNDSEQPIEIADKTEEAVETPEENQQKVEESEVEKDQKSPVSPTNPVVAETSSPFRRFFTQGWAGLRKKTSFRKSKEEDPQEVEKHVKVEEQEMVEAQEAVKEENATETQPTADKELSKSSSEDSKVSTEENKQPVTEEKPKEEEPSPDAEPKLEESIKVDEVVSVAENKESIPEVTLVPETIAGPEIKAEAEIVDVNVETETTDGIANGISESAEEITKDLQEICETRAVDNDQPQLASSSEGVETEKSQEAITTEAELLSSQEKAKLQGSPLKKLFSSSGLRKLSGKKSKSKKDDEGKIDATTEAITSESPEAPDINAEDSSPSSPDESADTSPTEKPVDADQQAAEGEAEGTTSDGERKKDGITPWASFKKLVTPKRRPKRPSESDKEDEVEKVKTSTMSSTESAGTVENQEEPKETNEEQKLEKSTEESKKKVDSSVSWEALICVGSSKKRARKTSDSDSDEGIKSQDEAKKAEEVVPAKETDSDSPITSSQEQPLQESTSPDQPGSPTEGDGVSTWQSFKRLVTPRRKSRTRAEEKTDETAAAANAEQSTSDGETGKDETWVSFKKLIPGRKKKKSDGKQEHPTTETGQPLNEAAEDDSDEPTVVPLSEFDAAEQEKLDAQKSLDEAVPAVVREQEESTEELIHAVTVTVIEGERAITSLEERSPSWISAKVSETIEHAKETEEAAERIKTEITVEETVILSTVSQVNTEIPKTLINEMELTSEALTALEEAIENSCAEETTEMISAVSQLGESVVSTEEATPVPEEDASVKTLEDQKKHTENILHEAAEKAKLTIDTLEFQTSQDVTDLSTINIQDSVMPIVCGVAPLCAEESTILTPVTSEHQDDKSIIVTAEETVQQTEERCEDASYSFITAPVVQVFSTVLEAVATKDDSPAAEAALTNEDLITSTELKDNTDDLDKVLAEELSAVHASNELQTKEADSVSAENVSGKVQPEDIVAVSSDVQAEELVSASSELQSEENVSVSGEVQPEEVVPVASEMLSENIVAVSNESGDVQSEEVANVSSELQCEQVVFVLHQMQPEESLPVLCEEQPKEVVPISTEEQPEVIPEASNEMQSVEVVAESSEVQPEEVIAQSSEVQPEEVIAQSSEVQPEEDLAQSSEAQPVEAVAELSEEQPNIVVPELSEVQPKEVVPESSEVQPKEVVPESSEVQPKEVVPESSKVQPKEVVPESSEVQPKEVVPESSEVQPKEVVPESSEVQPKEVVPESSEFTCQRSGT